MTIATEVSTPVEPSMDRDQRTVRVTVYTDRHPHSHLPHRSPQCCIHCRRRRHNLYQRLGEVLTISACLLSLVRWPTAMAAPPHSPKRRSIHDLPPRWINPCGFILSSDESGQLFSDLPDIPTSTDFLKNIVTQVKNALSYAEGFKTEYAKQIFKGKTFEEVHALFKGARYSWYPSDSIPKELGVNTHPDKLRVVQLDSFLKEAYRYMQIMLVAMEQVAFDNAHPVRGSVFAQNFTDMQFKLRYVLCELQTLMTELGVVAHSDVTRDVMSDDIRNLKDNTFRLQRDWIIFRDTINALEYIRDVAQYFVDNPDRIPPS